MPSDHRYPNAVAWGGAVLAHGNATGHWAFLWDDIVGAAFGLRCSYCEHRFLVSRDDVHLDRSPQARLFRDFTNSTWGKARILANLNQPPSFGRVRDVLNPFEPPDLSEETATGDRPTSWARILEDETESG